MIRRARWPVAVLAALAVVAVPQVASGGSHKALIVCGASQLRGRVHDSSGGVGTLIVSFVLRNHGSPCMLRGYAGLKLRKGSGALPTRVFHGHHFLVNQQVRNVSMRRGGSATILVVYGDVPVGNEQLCPTSSALAITPPGQSGKLTVPVLIGACGRGSLFESPVLSGIRPAQ
jgi:hypothetical protein